MNSQEINDLIDSDFEELPDDSDDDPTWELSHDVYLSSKCLYISIYNSKYFFFYFTYFHIILYYVDKSGSETDGIQTNRCLFPGSSNHSAN